MSQSAARATIKATSESLPSCLRSQQLNSQFTAAFNTVVEFYVRVPGRVNLIGEHIDYSGYGVCPMALEQDVLLAISRNDKEKLCLANMDRNYQPFECDIKQLIIDLSGPAPQWYQYFLCGMKGIYDTLAKDAILTGINVMVSGTIPQSAGLSSSSALVVSAALATAYSHDVELSREEMASICAKCERYIGTQGGGMDQAIALLASKSCAKLIEFDPLRSEDVQLPQSAVFVIAHSLVELNKASTADYNCRVVECRLAAQILAKKNGLEWRKVKKLGEVQSMLNADLKAMTGMVARSLHEEAYSKTEILGILETSSDDLERASFTENTKHLDTFRLFQRATHVYQEAQRVQQFHLECRNSSTSGDSTLMALGNLMTASHNSLRDLYECSHPQLDRLVELSRAHTFGARLTGAGWGGCMVALLDRTRLQEYIAMLREKFYLPLNMSENSASVLFATEPQAGAAIFLH